MKTLTFLRRVYSRPACRFSLGGRVICQVLAVVLMLPSLQAQSPWKWLNPKPQGNALRTVRFLNDSIGHACGNVGTVIKTTDGGANWILLPTPTREILTDVYFLNEDTGFCGMWWNYASSEVYYLKTTDGGANWAIEFIQSDTTNNYFVDRVIFTSPEHGVISTGGSLYVTTDGGQSWTRVPENSRDIQFLDTYVGFQLDDDGVSKTTDGGFNWMPIAGSPPCMRGCFLNDQTGYVLRSGSPDRVYKTTDGGQSWTDTTIGDLGSLAASSISFANKDTGYVAAYKDGGATFAALRTTDGGQTWAPLAIPNISSSSSLFFSVHAPSDNIAYISGNGGYIWKTTDAGQTWVSQRKGGDWLRRCMFFTPQLAYATVYPSTNNSHYGVMKTTDGGLHWYFTRYDSHVGSFTEPVSLYILDSNEVIVGADIYRMYRTTNGGQNWIEYYDESFWFPTDIDFVSPTEGFCVATQSIVKTTNAGVSWQVKHVHSAHTYTIDMVDSLTGYVSGSTHVLKTTDGGENWQALSTGISASMYDVSFLDGETGYAAGGFSFGDPAIVKTTDGGASWIDLTAYLNNSGFDMERLEFVDFVDENSGYIADIYGKIAHTTDGGFAWTDEQLTSNGLSSLEHLDAENMYAFGSYGTIIVRGDDWITDVPAREVRNLKPRTPILRSSYPNPFNASTTIVYELPSAMDITLDVYNILGQKVRTLKRGYAQAGQQRVSWDGKDDEGRVLSSGVYLVRLYTPLGTSVRKVMMIK